MKTFAAVAVEVASCFFVCLFPSRHFLSVVGDWHKLYAYFFASYLHGKLVSILCWQDAGYGEKSLFSCDDDNDDSESKNIDDEVMTILLFWFVFEASFFFLKKLIVIVVSSSRFAQRHGTPHEHLFLQWKENVSWLWQDLRTPPDVGRDFRTFGSPTSPWQTRYQLRYHLKNTPLSSHLLFPNLGYVIFSREFFVDLYMAEARFTLVLLASIVKTGSIKHKR